MHSQTRKDTVLREAYQEYLKVRSEGKSRDEALEVLSHLHSITMARLVQLLSKEENAQST